jgi:hypothetical protein
MMNEWQVLSKAIASPMTELGASETKFELTAGREAVFVDQLARNVHELWHAVSFLLAKLARSRISSGKNNCVDWRTRFKL